MCIRDSLEAADEGFAFHLLAGVGVDGELADAVVGFGVAEVEADIVGGGGGGEKGDGAGDEGEAEMAVPDGAGGGDGRWSLAVLRGG